MSHSIVMRSRSGTVRMISTQHRWDADHAGITHLNGGHSSTGAAAGNGTQV